MPPDAKFAAIRLLRIKNMSAEEIHGELCTRLAPKMLGERPVRQSCRVLKDWGGGEIN
jgi:hypothetical protein